LHFDTAKTSLEAISKAIAQVGHDTEFDKAPDDVYNALPGCCKYRK
jgi:Cu(I)/Ag(I) efflux system membrane fusion protein